MKPTASPSTPRPRGFAALSAERQREIARKGGKALYRVRGRAYMSGMGQRGGQLSAYARKRRERAMRQEGAR